MKIIYKNANWREGESSSDVLGVVEHTDHPEVLIPFQKNGHAASYIAKKFSGNHNTIIWEVVDVVLNGDIVEVLLVGMVSPSSLATQAEKVKQSVNRLVSNFCLVDVDFGHKASLASSGGIIGDNTWDISTHLPTEIYKKRPCVVLSVDGNRIQIVPLTTSERATQDNFHVEVSVSSFSGLSSHYKSKPSYILTKMIQTVSAFRVYPPKLETGKYPLNSKRYKLCSTDKTNLLKNLASIYSHVLVQEHEVLEMRLERLSTERRNLLEAKAESDRNALMQKHRGLQSKVAG